MVRQKIVTVIMMFISLSCITAFGLGTRASEATNGGILKEQILSAYQSNGTEGVLDFLKNKTDRATPKFIIDLAKSGVKEKKREWLDIALAMAENRRDEETQVEVQDALLKENRRTAPLSQRVDELKLELKEGLTQFCQRFGIDVLIVENASTIPVNIPLGLAASLF